MRLQPVTACADKHDVLPVAVISLPESIERRETLRARGIPSDWVERYWPATDLREAIFEELRSFADLDEVSSLIGRVPGPGEIGCAVAHRSVARWLAESEYDMVLVLEDDAIPARTQFDEEVAAVACVLAGHARAGAAFVCHLGPPAGQVEHAIKRRIALPSRGRLRDDMGIWLHSDPVRPLWRAHAYLLSKGAAKRQGDLEPRVATLADDWLARRRLGLVDEIFFMQPKVIAQDEACATTLDPLTRATRHNTGEGRASSRGRVETSLSARRFSERAANSLKYRVALAKARLRTLLPYRLSEDFPRKDGGLG